MKVCVLGATGATGQWVTKMLLDKGYEVTVYVRNPKKITLTHSALHIVHGELTDKARLVKVFLNQDAVMSCLGSSTMKKSNQLETMAIAIGSAMKASGVERILYMATAGIEDEFTGIFKIFIRMILGNVIDDHRKAAQYYQSNGFVYTILRPLQLKDGEPNGSYQEALVGLPKSRKAVSRSNVAKLMIKALEDERYLNTSVSVSE
jgi:uncharacterized protein YbjT (DUF2867 family)